MDRKLIGYYFDDRFINLASFQAKRFDGSSSSNVKLVCFFLSCIVVNCWLDKKKQLKTSQWAHLGNDDGHFSLFL